MFEEVAYEVELLRMIAEGYLAPITTKATTDTKLDTSGVAKRGGEFIESQLQAAVDKAGSPRPPWLNRGGWSGSPVWLVFSTGVQHGFHIRDELRQLASPRRWCTARCRDTAGCCHCGAQIRCS